MIREKNEISWDMLVVGANGNKRILVPARNESDKCMYNEDHMQVFEDLNGLEYAFNCGLRTKNSLEYYDRDGHIIKDILDYPQVLQKFELKQKDMVSLGTIKRMQNELNTLVEDEYETL